MQLGSVTHAAILEPDRFQSEFVCAPVLDKRTKAGKEKFAQFEEENKGKVVVHSDMYSKTIAMRDAVYANSAAKKLLVAGKPEQSGILIEIYQALILPYESKCLAASMAFVLCLCLPGRLLGA